MPDTAALRAALHQLGLPALWAWWLEQLRGLLPAWLLRLVGLGGVRLEFVPSSAEGFTVRARFPGDEPAVIGEIDAATERAQVTRLLRERAAGGGRQCALVLPEGAFFARVVTLPAATEQNLAGVLRFEMDRQTPFTADQVYHDYTVLERDAREHTLRVLLVVARRRSVDDSRELLAALGVPVAAVSPEVRPNSGGDPAWLNLLPAAQRSGGGRRWQRRAAAGVTVALLVAALLVPLWMHRGIVLELQGRMNALSDDVARLNTLQERRQRLSDVLEAPARLRDQRAAATRVVAELTRLLPDDTHLSSLRIEDGEIRLEGESASASRLIERLEGSAMLTGVQFIASVERSGDGREQFSIGGRLVTADPEGGA